MNEIEEVKGKVFFLFYFGTLDIPVFASGRKGKCHFTVNNMSPGCNIHMGHSWSPASCLHSLIRAFTLTCLLDSATPPLTPTPDTILSMGMGQELPNALIFWSV